MTRTEPRPGIWGFKGEEGPDEEGHGGDALLSMQQDFLSGKLGPSSVKLMRQGQPSKGLGTRRSNQSNRISCTPSPTANLSNSYIHSGGKDKPLPKWLDHGSASLDLGGDIGGGGGMRIFKGQVKERPTKNASCQSTAPVSSGLEPSLFMKRRQQGQEGAPITQNIISASHPTNEAKSSVPDPSALDDMTSLIESLTPAQISEWQRAIQSELKDDHVDFLRKRGKKASATSVTAPVTASKAHPLLTSESKQNTTSQAPLQRESCSDEDLPMLESTTHTQRLPPSPISQTPFPKPSHHTEHLSEEEMRFLMHLGKPILSEKTSTPHRHFLATIDHTLTVASLHRYLRSAETRQQAYAWQLVTRLSRYYFDTHARATEKGPHDERSLDWFHTFFHRWVGPCVHTTTTAKAPSTSVSTPTLLEALLSLVVHVPSTGTVAVSAAPWTVLKQCLHFATDFLLESDMDSDGVVLSHSRPRHAIQHEPWIASMSAQIAAWLARVVPALTTNPCQPFYQPHLLLPSPAYRHGTHDPCTYRLAVVLLRHVLLEEATEGDVDAATGTLLRHCQRTVKDVQAANLDELDRAVTSEDVKGLRCALGRYVWLRRPTCSAVSDEVVGMPSPTLRPVYDAWHETHRAFFWHHVTMMDVDVALPVCMDLLLGGPEALPLDCRPCLPMLLKSIARDLGQPLKSMSHRLAAWALVKTSLLGHDADREAFLDALLSSASGTAHDVLRQGVKEVVANGIGVADLSQLLGAVVQFGRRGDSMAALASFLRGYATLVRYSGGQDVCDVFERSLEARLRRYTDTGFVPFAYHVRRTMGHRFMAMKMPDWRLIRATCCLLDGHREANRAVPHVLLTFLWTCLWVPTSIHMDSSQTESSCLDVQVQQHLMACCQCLLRHVSSLDSDGVWKAHYTDSITRALTFALGDQHLLAMLQDDGDVDGDMLGIDRVLFLFLRKATDRIDPSSGIMFRDLLAFLHCFWRQGCSRSLRLRFYVSVSAMMQCNSVRQFILADRDGINVLSHIIRSMLSDHVILSKDESISKKACLLFRDIYVNLLEAYGEDVAPPTLLSVWALLPLMGDFLMDRAAPGQATSEPWHPQELFWQCINDKAFYRMPLTLTALQAFLRDRVGIEPTCTEALFLSDHTPPLSTRSKAIIETFLRDDPKRWTTDASFLLWYGRHALWRKK